MDDFKAKFDYVANKGTWFLFITNLDSPKNRLIAVDISKPYDPSSFVTLIPEGEDLLQDVSCVNKSTQLVTKSMHHVKEVLRIYNLEENWQKATLDKFEFFTPGYN